MIVHQIWVGPPRPAHLDRMAETWRTQHPDWDYLLWDETAIDALDLDNRGLYDRAEELVPADAVGQYRADIARYEILHRYGGVYADLDTTCQKPIDGLLPDGYLVAGWEVEGKWVGNTVLAAPAGHPALAEIIRVLPGLARRHAPTRPNRLSGPKAITPILRRRKDVRLLDQRIFYPVAWNEPLRSDTEPHPGAYVVHHWQHQRDLHGLRAPTVRGADA